MFNSDGVLQRLVGGTSSSCNRYKMKLNWSFFFKEKLIIFNFVKLHKIKRHFIWNSSVFSILNVAQPLIGCWRSFAPPLHRKWCWQKCNVINSPPRAHRWCLTSRQRRRWGRRQTNPPPCTSCSGYLSQAPRFLLTNVHQCLKVKLKDGGEPQLMDKKMRWTKTKMTNRNPSRIWTKMIN